MYKRLPRPKSNNSQEDYLLQPEFSVPELAPAHVLGEAIFAAGCFWQLESAFGRADGVLRTATGYCGGSLVKPSRREVVEGWTGHTEAVRVTYDKTKTSYKSMCNIFWASHEPTNKEYLQFGVNTHYQSAIFYSNEEERKQAQRSKVEKQMKLNRRIVTKIISLHQSEGSAFYMAESNNQKYYLQKNHMHLCESLSLRSAKQLADSYLACKLNGLICGGKKSSTVEELKKFVTTHELPHKAKLILETTILDLSVEQDSEVISRDENLHVQIPKDSNLGPDDASVPSSKEKGPFLERSWQFTSA